MANHNGRCATGAGVLQMREMNCPYSFVRPPTASLSDDVAVIAPASGLTALFPGILDIGVNRLQENFDGTPQVYPTADKYPEYPFDLPGE